MVLKGAEKSEALFREMVDQNPHFRLDVILKAMPEGSKILVDRRQIGTKLFGSWQVLLRNGRAT